MAEVYIVGPATAELMTALEPVIVSLIDDRDGYRASGDWVQADSIQLVLASLRIGSYRLRFKDDGWRWSWTLGPPRQVESA